MATATGEPMTTNDRLRAIGAGAYSSIVEMVAALECDYDRLEELRDEREYLQDEVDAIAKSADEPDEDETDHRANLAEWDEENGDELKELTEAAGECKDQDEARERIQEDALSVRIFGERTDGEWEADRFEILLTTGGPAVRIMGELDANAEPSHAYLESQDWGTPWTEYYTTGIRDTLLAYCRCFCFE